MRFFHVFFPWYSWVSDSNLSLIGPGDESVSPCGVHNHIGCAFPLGETDSSPDIEINVTPL
jgi:hypothetical protein